MEAKAILFTSLLLENRAVSESIYNTLDITIIANTTKDSGKDEFPLLPGLINKSQPVILVSGAIKFNLLLGLEIDTNDINKEINVIAVNTVVNENIITEIEKISTTKCNRENKEVKNGETEHFKTFEDFKAAMSK